MSDEERQTWDERYASGDYVPRAQPSAFLDRWLLHVPRGRALDVACGTGRNALHLAGGGFEVDAVDVSQVALDQCQQEADRRGLPLRTHQADLDRDPLPAGPYALVAVMRYRNPHLWSKVRTVLAPDGWVVVEHHLRTHLDVGGPSNPSFRIEPGELLRAFEGLRVVHHSESIEDADAGDHPRFAITRFAACNGSPGW